MKHDLHQSSNELLHATIEDLGIPNTIENRNALCTAAINFGLVSVAFSRGLFQQLNEKFEMDVVAEKEQPEPITEIPEVCPKCNKPVVEISGRLVCNCRIWSERKT